MSQTAMLRSFEQVTIIPEKKIFQHYFASGHYISDGPRFRIVDSLTVAESKMKDGLAVVNESVDHFSGGGIPHADGGVGGTGNDVVLVVLKTQDGPGVTR